jgi:hypothetical protein
MSTRNTAHQKLETDESQTDSFSTRDSLISTHLIDDTLKIFSSNEDSLSVEDNLKSTITLDKGLKIDESDDGSMLSIYDESILLEKQSLLMSPRSVLSHKVKSSEDSESNLAESDIQQSGSFDTKVGDR